MKQLNKLFNYIILLMVVGYGTFFFYGESIMKPQKPAGQFELSSNDIDQVVNKHLKQTTETIEKEQFNSEKAIYKALRQPLKISTAIKETNPEDVLVSQQIWKESEVSVSAADQINSSVYDQMALQKQNEQERKQYAKDFIDNARRGGFHVELSEDLSRILRVTPIRKPSQDDDSYESNPSN